MRRNSPEENGFTRDSDQQRGKIFDFNIAHERNVILDIDPIEFDVGHAIFHYRIKRGEVPTNAAPCSTQANHPDGLGRHFRVVKSFEVERSLAADIRILNPGKTDYTNVIKASFFDE